jgi:hypothetical protein
MTLQPGGRRRGLFLDLLPHQAARPAVLATGVPAKTNADAIIEKGSGERLGDVAACERVGGAARVPVRR